MAPLITLPPQLDHWLEQLEERHFSDLRWPEVRRGIQALSTLYVERRDKLPEGKALDGAGKRAGFAVFYAPLHFLMTHEVVRALGAARFGKHTIYDLGCGTGAGGAAWATLGGGQVIGIDRHGWAVEEARRTFKDLGVKGTAKTGDVLKTPLPGDSGAILCSYTINEVDDPTRDALRPKLLAAARGGVSLLIIEPIAKRWLRWWPEWEEEALALGGRTDEWKFRLRLPRLLRELDRSAGLNHSELKSRSLYIPGREPVRMTPEPAG